MTSESSKSTNDEIAHNGTASGLTEGHILFTDLVGFSNIFTDKQPEHLQTYQDVLLANTELQRADKAGKVLKLPTGDGVAVVFFDDSLAHVRCAIELSRALRGQPNMKLRMGLHSGLVSPLLDINSKKNVVGEGINFAQRVMDTGDAGHILASERVANQLRHLSEWAGCVHDLGDVRVKHGKIVQMSNLYSAEFGNPDRPSKTNRRKRVLMAVAAIFAALLLAAGVVMLRKQPGTPALVSNSPVISRTLGYWITVQKFRNGKPFEGPFRLAKEINFERDYRLKIGFVSPDSGHLYLFNEGPPSAIGISEYNVLFPTSTTNNFSSRLEANTELQIPDSSWFTFDQEQGTEKLWVIWSSQEIPELERLKQAATSTEKGMIRDASQLKVLSDFLRQNGSSEQKVWNDSAKQQTFISQTKEPLIGVIKLEHH